MRQFVQRLVGDANVKAWVTWEAFAAERRRQMQLMRGAAARIALQRVAYADAQRRRPRPRPPPTPTAVAHRHAHRFTHQLRPPPRPPPRRPPPPPTIAPTTTVHRRAHRAAPPAGRSLAFEQWHGSARSISSGVARKLRLAAGSYETRLLGRVIEAWATLLDERHAREQARAAAQSTQRHAPARVASELPPRATGGERRAATATVPSPCVRLCPCHAAAAAPPRHAA
eukprot:3855802-Prymnesium_polylepis.1